MKRRFRSFNQVKRSELKYGWHNKSEPIADSRTVRRLKNKGKSKRLGEIHVADTKRQ